MSTLTTEGMQIRTREDIVTQIGNNLIANFGSLFDVSPESPDGQVIGIIADAIYNEEVSSQAAYQSSDPDSAIGVALEYVCEYNGVFRQEETATTVVVQLTGTAGTVVPEGSLVSDGNEEYTTTASATIPSDVTVTCNTLGRVEVAANTVQTVVSSIVGWDGVDNNLVGVTGLDRESDAQLRNRRARSTINSGVNTIEAIYESLNKLGTEFVAIEVNDTNVPTTIPPHSFLTVVSGGSDQGVAESIFANKPAGILSSGTTTVAVLDSKNYSHDISFSRPTPFSIEIELEFQRLAGASNETIETMRSNLLAYITNIQIGDNVIWSRVFGIAAASEGVAIRTLTIAEAGGVHGTADIALLISQKAVTTNAQIGITEV